MYYLQTVLRCINAYKGIGSILETVSSTEVIASPPLTRFNSLLILLDWKIEDARWRDQLITHSFVLDDYVS